jgi:hypothetical protein
MRSGERQGFSHERCLEQISERAARASRRRLSRLLFLRVILCIRSGSLTVLLSTSRGSEYPSPLQWASIYAQSVRRRHDKCRRSGGKCAGSQDQENNPSLRRLCTFPQLTRDLRPSGKTTASSQLTGPELHPADVYITTDSSALKLLDQGTILHEALHNRTGRYDDDLERLLGLDPSKDCPRGSICITEKLKAVGCAGPNQ